MRKYTVEKMEKVVEEIQLDQIICNQCGEVCAIEGEVYTAQYSWGYGSSYDGESHEFDLCRTCYDKFIAGFKVPVKVKESL